MRRPPFLPTLIVALAVAAMIALGIWQLRRAAWKEALLARYAAASGKPVLSGLPADVLADPDRAAFRRARLDCSASASEAIVLQIGGRDAGGRTGYRNIARCLLPGRAVLPVDIGWSPPGRLARATAGVAGDCPDPCATVSFTGRLIPDPVLAARVPRARVPLLPLLLVAETPRAGFAPSLPPTIPDIPNNHRAYAVQWFLFAGVALVIYLLALRRRAR